MMGERSCGRFAGEIAFVALLVVASLGCGTKERQASPPPEPDKGEPVASKLHAPSDEQRCDGGDANACRQAAAALLAAKANGAGLKASTLLARACALHDIDGCFELGTLQETGDSSVESTEKALATFEQACGAGHEQSCMHLAAIYLEGKGVPIDPRKGMRYDEQACARAATSAACDVLGWLLVSGQEGAPRDLKRGLSVLEASARGGSAKAKEFLANAYAEGLTGTKDARRALGLYEDACAGSDAFSCYSAGDYYHHGTGATRDLKKAVDLLSKACTEGYEPACTASKEAAQDQEVASSIDVRDLWRTYDENEVAADNQFKGRTLVATGSVQSIDKDVAGVAVVELESPNELAPVGVYVRDDQMATVAKLRKRDMVVLRCVCDGKTMMSPILRDCVFVTIGR